MPGGEEVRACKKVLLCWSDELSASLLKFVLENTIRYRVWISLNLPSSKKVLIEVHPDAVIADAKIMWIDEFIDYAKNLNMDMPIMAQATTYARAQEIEGADMVFVNLSMEDLLVRLRVMSVGKRGPKKGTIRK